MAGHFSMVAFGRSARHRAAGLAVPLLLCACGPAGLPQPAPGAQSAAAAAPGAAALVAAAPGAAAESAPAIGALSPSSVVAGGAAFTLAVHGSDFTADSRVHWNGTPLPTTYVGPSELRASVPAAVAAAVATGAGDLGVTVVNGGGAASNFAALAVAAANPVPSISTLSPAIAASGSPAFTLTVSGSDFVPGAVVNWSGLALPTTFVAASRLTALVAAADLPGVGDLAITVVNPPPGGGPSNTANFSVDPINPVPAAASLSPAAAAAGGAAFTLAVNGSEFVAGSAVLWNGVPLASSYVSAAQLTAAVPAADIAAVGTAQVSVSNPAPGGGTTSPLPFAIAATNPAPSITSIAPAIAAAGSLPFTLAVSGSGFVAASSVRWNGTALATTYVGAASLTALVPASLLTAAGARQVTVVNPAAGGGASNVATFTIEAVNPAPSLASISPNGAAAGASALTLTVNGSDFVAAAVVKWNGIALATTYVGPSRLTALVPASLLAHAGGVVVTVATPAPGGGASAGLAFTVGVDNPIPTLAGLSPASAAVGGAGFALSVSGANFVAASVVAWNGVPLATTYLDASNLTALVPAADLAAIGAATVTVTSPAPGGGKSGAGVFTIVASNPVPSLASLSATSAAAGSPAFALAINGAGFAAGAVVEWNGAALATTHVSATALTALVPAADLAAPGTATVTVVNPAPGGGSSAALGFSIVASNPAPAIATLAPASAAAGSTAVTITVTGGPFVAASTVRWNGSALATTYVSAAKVTALVPASDLATAGSAAITVVNPAPGGGTSGSIGFTVTPIAPSGAHIRQAAQYTAYPGAVSASWSVTLNVLQGSAIYVVGMWPNYYSSYPTMAVTDGTNEYVQLGRYDDLTLFNLGIQGTQSMGHWYAANVKAGTYTITMSPSSETWEDWVGVVAFEVAGVTANPLDGSTIGVQPAVAPGSNTIAARVTNSHPSGLFIAVTFDEVDATAPTLPLVAGGFTGVFPSGLWDLTKTGKPSANAEYQLINSAGAHTATFSAQEPAVGGQAPDYLTTGAIFH